MIYKFIDKKTTLFHSSLKLMEDIHCTNAGMYIWSPYLDLVSMFAAKIMMESFSIMTIIGHTCQAKHNFTIEVICTVDTNTR